MTDFKSIYFAGALFSNKDLIGNALLADAIHKCSNSRYQCILPQNCEQRETTALAIRDQDLLLVTKCDLGLFHFDGTELDSGTVVEYLFAKFLDKPAVILRTDFRKGGDAGTAPWNLMLIEFPRSEVIIIDAMAEYQKYLSLELANSGASLSDLEQTASAGARASYEYSKAIAQKVVKAFDKLCSEPALLKGSDFTQALTWLSKLAGPSFEKLFNQELFDQLHQRRGL